MKLRILGAIGAFAIVLPSIVWPVDWWIITLLSVISFWCTLEFLTIVRGAREVSKAGVLKAIWIWSQAALLLVGAFSFVYFIGAIYLLLAIKMVERTLRYSEKQSVMLFLVEPLMVFFYTVLPFYCFYKLFGLGLGNTPVWILGASVWATDIGAYMVGRKLGKRKLAPHLSPNKTWEGSAGGLLIAIGVVSLLREFKIAGFSELSWGLLLAATVVCSLAGQLGDLLESWLKRRANVKDSGRFLPGHGGALDRLDSIILAAPLLFALLSVMMSL